MRMAFCIRATGPIFDGCDNAEYALAAGIAVNAEAVGTIQARQRLGLIVTAVAGLSFFIENVAYFRRVGGVADPALLVKDAHLDHARFIRDALDRVVKTGAV